jgi:predicted transcriptional regulator
MSDFTLKMGSLDIPLLPYAGTSGHSGSNTSEERARTQDKDGTTKLRQSQTLTHLRHNKGRGLTWKELSEITNWHHGQASGVLSVLHKEGLIARLKETRNRCLVYVAPEFVYGRPTEPHKSNRGLHDVNALMKEILKVLPNAVIDEAPDGELVIYTRMQVISSDEQIAPIGELHVQK